jgi:hypothetical protein
MVIFGVGTLPFVLLEVALVIRGGLFVQTVVNINSRV